MRMGALPPWPREAAEETDAEVRLEYGRAVTRRVELRNAFEAADLMVSRLKGEMRARGLLPAHPRMPRGQPRCGQRSANHPMNFRQT
jgi:hypothetical protein